MVRDNRDNPAVKLNIEEALATLKSARGGEFFKTENGGEVLDREKLAAYVRPRVGNAVPALEDGKPDYVAAFNELLADENALSTEALAVGVALHLDGIRGELQKRFRDIDFDQERCPVSMDELDALVNKHEGGWDKMVVPDNDGIMLAKGLYPVPEKNRDPASLPIAMLYAAAVEGLEALNDAAEANRYKLNI